MNKLYHEKLSPMFKPELRKSNEIALEFEGLKSRIDIDTSRNKSAGRSHTYQIVHKSESAYFAFPKEVNLGIANSVPDLPGTMIFDETTANGINFHYDDVQRSIKGEDGFDFVFIPWFMNPEYSLPLYEGQSLVISDDEKQIVEDALKTHSIVITEAQLNWRRFTITHKCSGDESTFCQEYPSNYAEAFIFSGRPRFDINILRRLKNTARNPKRQNGLLNIYSEYDPLCVYTIGIDTSEGLETGDNSSVVILDCFSFKVAAEYNGKLAPDVLAGYAAQWGKMYRNALIVVEDNNHGLVTLNELKQIYDNLYFRKNFDEKANAWTEKLGFRTSSRTKPLLIGNLDKALRDELDPVSHDIIDELMTYKIGEDGDTNAAEGKHDDRVIGLALAYQGFIESKKHLAEETNTSTRYSLNWLKKFEKNATTLRRRSEPWQGASKI